jgi:Uma2 family endonuclease
MSTSLPRTEPRVVLHDVSWATFRALSREARGGRLVYDRGRLEIMVPSFEHENVKGLIGRLVEVYAEELDIDIASGGSMTLGREDLDRGIESDECYYIANAPRVRGKETLVLPVDPPPDLAIEVDLASSSSGKLEIYAALGITEVWRYAGDSVTIYRLHEDGHYAPSPTSAALPQFPIQELNRLLRSRGLRSETQLARRFRKWILTHLRDRLT